MPEARLRRRDHGLEPDGDGWFVLNARDSRWSFNEDMGWYCNFESETTRFPDLGINLNVMQPGQPMAMYHTEDAQEDFLVLAGEALAIVEGEERTLRQWDLFHCPAYVAHTIIGAGDGPCVVLAVGARIPGREDGVFAVSEAAIRRGVGVEEETRDGRSAYARFAPNVERAYEEGVLP